MAINDRFDGCAVNLVPDKEGDWLMHFVEMPNVSAFAGTLEQAPNKLATAWEGVNESYWKRGEEVPLAPPRKEYGGQFNVRIDKCLHRVIAVEAAQAGISWNAIVSQKLAQSVRHEREINGFAPLNP